jgi:hypothetical protein
MSRFQYRPLSLAEAPIFDLVFRPKSADCPSVSKGVELMPDKSQVLAVFEALFIEGDSVCRARLHK